VVINIKQSFVELEVDVVQGWGTLKIDARSVKKME
jgi:hypothetical protein